VKNKQPPEQAVLWSLAHPERLQFFWKKGQAEGEKICVEKLKGGVRFIHMRRKEKHYPDTHTKKKKSPYQKIMEDKYKNPRRTSH